MIFVFDEKTNQMSGTEVNPSTLGECTSLTDKNGKLIFEGDIIDLNGVFDCESAEGFYKVVWDDAYASFYFESIAEMPYAGDIEYDAAYGEVVGNIYDNPEILQKGAAADE